MPSLQELIEESKCDCNTGHLDQISADLRDRLIKGGVQINSPKVAHLLLSFVKILRDHYDEMAEESAAAISETVAEKFAEGGISRSKVPRDVWFEAGRKVVRNTLEAMDPFEISNAMVLGKSAEDVLHGISHLVYMKHGR